LAAAEAWTLAKAGSGFLAFSTPSGSFALAGGNTAANPVWFFTGG
jgi:hypothetical protein